MLHNSAPPVRRRPPVAAILAAPLALLSALAVAFFGVIALAFSNGDLTGGGWLLVAVPAVLAVALVVGAVLLLLLGCPFVALVLVLTPPVRHWLAGRS